MDQITVRGKILSKSDFVDNPEKYRNRNVIVFEFANENHYEAMRQFYREWKANMDRELLLSVGFQPQKFHERASNLFFAMRDQLAKHMGDTSRANKDAIYHGLILDCEFRHIDGRIKQSIKDLDKKELWELCQRAQRELDETEFNYEFRAHLNDLGEDFGKP